MPNVDTHPVPAAEKRRHGSGFWAVAFAFLVVMADAMIGAYERHNAEVRRRVPAAQLLEWRPRAARQLGLQSSPCAR
jgi:hypothetical protein